jgi:uncharacterized integral membrane protein
MPRTKGGSVVFYIALLFLILLVAAALVMLIQNFAILLSSVHLTFFSWHLPGIPMFLLFLLGAFLGGLLLYIFSTRSVRHNAREIKKLNARVKELRAQIEELEKLQMRSPSGALSTNFAPPVPIFSPFGALEPSSPLGQRQSVQPPQPAQPPQPKQPKWRQDSSWLK